MKSKDGLPEKKRKKILSNMREVRFRSFLIIFDDLCQKCLLWSSFLASYNTPELPI